MSHHAERGFTLITTAISSIAAIGMLGLAIDVGRMYIVRNEMQAYADAAALSAALVLDGTSSGISRAAANVSASTNRWHLGTNTFTGTLTDFALDAGGPWQANPNPAAGYRFARVQAQAPVPLYFLPVVVSRNTSTLTVTSIAGQISKTSFREGLFPFSPFSHDKTAPDFGFIPGQIYTLRWAASPKAGHNVCQGDNAQMWIDQATAGGGDERGFIEQSSSSIIRATIEDDYQSVTREIGDSLTMTGGAKQTQRDSLINRVLQDTDSTSTTFAAYTAAGRGNFRRLIAAPVNEGYPTNILQGFGAFFLSAASAYPNGGNNPFCAEYVGPYVRGAKNKGAGSPGAYAAVLVQ